MRGGVGAAYGRAMRSVRVRGEIVTCTSPAARLTAPYRGPL